MTTNLSIPAHGEINHFPEPQIPICKTSRAVLTYQGCSIKGKERCVEASGPSQVKMFFVPRSTQLPSLRNIVSLRWVGEVGVVPHATSRWCPRTPSQTQASIKAAAALPCTLRHNPAPFPACLPFPVIPGPRQKVAHNTLCLSADSWKVMLNYGCSWVGLKGSFFSPFLSFKIFFCLP